MPFKSEAQRKYLWANEPKIAKKWQKHTPKNKKLPKKVSKEDIEKFTTPEEKQFLKEIFNENHK